MLNKDSIAFTLYLNTWLGCDENLSEFSENTIRALYKKWCNDFIPTLQKEHCGDCTNVPRACMRCITEELFENAAAIDKVLKEYKNEQSEKCKNEEIPQ